MAQSSTVCPYCKTVLEQALKRKKKCPSCGKLIFIRDGRPVTEEEAKIQDNLGWLQLTRADFDKCRAGLSKEFGSVASVNDTTWRLLNAQVATAKNLTVIEQAYRGMARIATEECKDPQPYLMAAKNAMKTRINQVTREAFEHEMAEICESGPFIKAVQIQTCNDEYVCPGCREIASKTWPMIQVPKLPYANCTSDSGCRCWVTATIVR